MQTNTVVSGCGQIQTQIRKIQVHILSEVSLQLQPSRRRKRKEGAMGVRRFKKVASILHTNTNTNSDKIREIQEQIVMDVSKLEKLVSQIPNKIADTAEGEGPQGQ